MLRALYLIEYAAAAVIVYAVVTQIILPLWRETPIFPWLEGERKLTHKLHDANQDVREARIERDIYYTKEEKKDIKASTKKGRR